MARSCLRTVKEKDRKINAAIEKILRPFIASYAAETHTARESELVWDLREILCGFTRIIKH